MNARAALSAAAAVLAAGCADDGPRRISESGFGAYEVSLAVRQQGIAVAWYDTRDGNAEIYLRLPDGEGKGAGRGRNAADERAGAVR